MTELPFSSSRKPITLQNAGEDCRRMSSLGRTSSPCKDCCREDIVCADWCLWGFHQIVHPPIKHRRNAYRLSVGSLNYRWFQKTDLTHIFHPENDVKMCPKIRLSIIRLSLGFRHNSVLQGWNKDHVFELCNIIHIFNYHTDAMRHVSKVRTWSRVTSEFRSHNKSWRKLPSP